MQQTKVSGPRRGNMFFILSGSSNREVGWRHWHLAGLGWIWLHGTAFIYPSLANSPRTLAAFGTLHASTLQTTTDNVCTLDDLAIIEDVLRIPANPGTKIVSHVGDAFVNRYNFECLLQPGTFFNDYVSITRQVAHPCGFEVDGLGFYHIPHAPLGPARNDNKTALVTVVGGTLNIQQLVQELVRLIPERWNWQPNQLGPNAFVVPFPTKADLQRSVAFGKADIREHGCSLHFEEWKEEDDGAPLDSVWIRVFRLPSKLREFPVLWVIGSILGATQAVDMTATANNNYGRVQVTVLNVNRIPRQLEVVIGDRFYLLQLQVEGRDPAPAAENMDVDGPNNDGNEGKDGKNKEKENDGEKKSEETPKKDDKEDGQSCSMINKQVTGAKSVAYMVLVEELNVTEETTNIMASKYPKNTTAVEVSDGKQGWVCVMHDDMRAACGLPLDSTGAQPGAGVGLEELAQPADAVQVADGALGSGLLAATGPNTQAWLEAALKISGQAMTPGKRSRRGESSADELSMERAQRLKAKRNLDIPRGYIHGYTLDENVVTIPEGGGKNCYDEGMSSLGDRDYGYLRQTWVEV